MQARTTRRRVNFSLGILLFVVAFGSGVLLGQVMYVRGGTVAAVAEAEAPTQVFIIDRLTNRSPVVDFNQFWSVWDRVKSKFVKTDVKDVDLFYGAVQGMVYALNDPYSSYFPPQPAAEFTKSLAGEFSGIGIEIGMKQNQILVIAPLPNTPAERAGLRPADKIMAINKRPTVGMDLNTAVNLIRGPEGTTTTLTIGREGWAKPRDFIITRSKINVPALIYSVKPGRVGYLRVMQFNEDTMREFDRVVRRIKRDGITGLIVDVRNNPGGFLDAAIQLSSEWVPEGRIVSERFRDGRENVHQSVGLHRLYGVPTVVLVNGGSASASEILAGALGDQGAAKIIGEKTYGKGSVQDFETFPDGSALKLTVAEWYTPKGTNINEKGITPDIVMKIDYDKEKIGTDAMINRALQELRKK
ncbi:MAG: S41 family peptidase [Candidatus Magasanikbacteria bacterium]|nr:S41 family peptidase [Candidatus Magasanikbacteria bacterium]